jgi:hypothetical protein
MNVHQIKQNLWQVDPGCFRLIHAVKTLIAISICLWIYSDASLLEKLFAGVASGFSIQGIDASTRKMQIVQIILSALAYSVTFLLGIFVSFSGMLTTITLMLLGFSVIYVRRFGPLFTYGPMLAWVFCFLATILPIESFSQGLNNIDGLIAGLIIAAFIYLFILPENHINLLLKNSQLFYQELAQGLLLAKKSIHLNINQADFDKQFFSNSKNNLLNLTSINQSINQYLLTSSIERNASRLITSQYTMLKAYSMLVEAFHGLLKSEKKIPDSIHHPLAILLDTLSKTLSKVQFNSNLECMGLPLELEAYFDKLNHVLTNIHLDDNQLIIALLNMKLSLRLLNKNYQILCNQK